MWICEPLSVHGGLTFSAESSPTKNGPYNICHPKEGAANEKVWWIVFDCSHIYDLMPDMLEYRNLVSFPDRQDVYRNFEYVKEQTETLAEQLTI